MPKLMTEDVAAILGVSRWRVCQLDAVLAPERAANGQRLYSPEIVERVRAERATAKAAKAAKVRARERRLARLDEIRERAARVDRFAKS